MRTEQSRLINLPEITSKGGTLTFIEEYKHIPFDVKRVYYVSNLTMDATRGFHAHRDIQEVAIAISGSFDAIVDDGYHKKKYSLNKKNCGLYMPEMVWREFSNFSADTIYLVLASNFFSEDSYIRTYSDFIEEINKCRNQPA